MVNEFIPFGITVISLTIIFLLFFFYCLKQMNKRAMKIINYDKQNLILSQFEFEQTKIKMLTFKKINYINTFFVLFASLSRGIIRGKIISLLLCTLLLIYPTMRVLCLNANFALKVKYRE